MNNTQINNKTEGLDRLLSSGTKTSFHYGEVLTEQFARSENFYLLINGQVSFHLTITDEEKEVLVGYSDKEGTPIGWSGLTSPKRYATTVKVSSAKAQLLKWKYSELEEFIASNQETSVEFLKMVCERSSFLIREAVLLLSKYSPILSEMSVPFGQEEYQNTTRPEEEDIQLFLRRSPFFEIFSESDLAAIVNFIERRQYLNGDTVYEQGKNSEGMFIMVSGKVSFSYQDSRNEHINFRELSSAGFIVGWSGALGGESLINAFASQDTVLYFIPNSCLEHLIATTEEFSGTFYSRLIWLMSNQLQAVRARLISLKFDKEIIAIRNLIDQNTSKIGLQSRIHQIPHLLKDKSTIQMGLRLINDVRQTGSSLEKSIAASAYDQLGEIRKEATFYDGLIGLYHQVTNSNDLSQEKVRKITARRSIELFENVPYIIQGVEHLPTEGGNIFIYNHLRNHPYNTLPNNFQITLDSHFISAMILHKTYGDPGIRIVRIGRGSEYGHQDYYDNQGHIDVYTSESDIKSNQKYAKEQKRQAFYEEAGRSLDSGLNLLISPEGTSFSTEESPGTFKSGAFRLALSCKKEPNIIPVAIANFDKRMRKNTLSCVIHKPFKVSDYITDHSDISQMKNFLLGYQHDYKLYVKEAISLAEKR